ncbi:LysR substrate-binding domain-containing protein [Streptomyces sp. NBC_01795]|uniref:LysR substrate-binding domain-containing protein n=1 Tax=unclassified Streptomyces TaxID=2593676 RepID=UPI002DD9F6C2|nr:MULTISPECIES: LysR substrate-binding domain-containing protein [unclassified Streptomyces]WSA92853.1 LysR substrate-binding domain-containing protein [Streptomyces sp. NBC_01795]WSB77223.1 LysR substrate-binding domain-containing protein [Streptomyces sp. NBC_01775]
MVQRPAPETRVEHLFIDVNVGVVRRGHPLLDGEITPERFAAFEHVTASRRGKPRGPIDELLAERGLRRRVVTSVPTMNAALLVVAQSDLVGRSGLRLAVGQVERLNPATFAFPFDLPSLPVVQAWHPRQEKDPAHAWLRGCVREIAAALPGGAAPEPVAGPGRVPGQGLS